LVQISPSGAALPLDVCRCVPCPLSPGSVLCAETTGGTVPGRRGPSAGAGCREHQRLPFLFYFFFFPALFEAPCNHSRPKSVLVLTPTAKQLRANPLVAGDAECDGPCADSLANFPPSSGVGRRPTGSSTRCRRPSRHAGRCRRSRRGVLREPWSPLRGPRKSWPPSGARSFECPCPAGGSPQRRRAPPAIPRSGQWPRLCRDHPGPSPNGKAPSDAAMIASDTARDEHPPHVREHRAQFWFAGST